MHLPVRMAVTIGSLAFTLDGSLTAVEAHADTTGVVGHLYVNDNTVGINTVAGFDRHADGSLTSIAGSPFPAGGAGTGLGIGSQGALQQSGDGRYLLVANAGSGQISVLRIRPDGWLRPVEGNPLSSGGSTPVTIAVHDDLVFVGNSGAVSNYTGFNWMTVATSIRSPTLHSHYRAQRCPATCSSVATALTWSGGASEPVLVPPRCRRRSTVSMWTMKGT
jgi:hypothetical protein